MKKSIDIMKIKMVRKAEVAYESISTADDAVCILRSLLDDLAQEEFWVLAANSKGVVSGAHLISRGDLSSTVTHPREIFKAAMLNNPAGIFLAHNHPSGDPAPSNEDIATTNRLIQAGELLGIPVVDHIIIGADGNYCSFANEGLL